MKTETTNRTHQERILEAALTYAALGWPVFPVHGVLSGKICTCSKGIDCGTDAGKHPRTPHGCKDATTDIIKIESWFGLATPHSNLGVRTGEVSGITVIDIDIGAKGGDKTWAELIKTADGTPDEPVTLTATTGSGGVHFIFQYNSALPTKKDVLGPGVDVRNDDGYIVVAPSQHYSGNFYKWDNWGQKIAALPARLSRAVKKDGRGRPRKDDVRRKKYTIEEVISMLAVIPADNRDDWRSIGIILGRAFERSDEAWTAYNEWSDKWGGKKGRNHDEIMREAFYKISQEPSDSSALTIGTLVSLAIEHGWAPVVGSVPIKRFVYNGPGNNFIYRPTISYWTAAAVDAACSPVNNGNGRIVKPSDWLRANQLVTSCTTDPTIQEDYLKGFDCRNGEVVEMEGAAMFNFYRRPTIELGDAKKVEPFLEHCHRIFDKPGDADQFLNYMAHRVQRPGVKPRFALMIAGEMGVGKDTAIEMCVPAIGVWNVASIEPEAFDSGFNEYVAKTLVRINEAANLHEMSKWAFNERTKVLIAGSPDFVTVNPKYGNKFEVRMYCGVIVTTNHLMGGIYIPEGDRRFDVIECATMTKLGLTDEERKREYFTKLWSWFLTEKGDRHIAAYLHTRDIKRFDPNMGQRKTAAHKTVVAANMSNDHWLHDILEELKRPDVVCASWILNKAVANGEKEMAVRQRLSSAIGRAGYFLFTNPTVADGRWRIAGKSCTVYVKQGISPTEEQILNIKQDLF